MAEPTSRRVAVHLPKAAVSIFESFWSAIKLTQRGQSKLSKKNVEMIVKECFENGATVNSEQIRNWFSKRRSKEKKATAQPRAEETTDGAVQVASSSEQQKLEHIRNKELSSDILSHLLEHIYRSSILRKTDQACWDLYTQYLYITRSIDITSDDHRQCTPVVIKFCTSLWQLYSTEYFIMANSSDCPTAFVKSKFSMITGPVRVLWDEVLFGLGIAVQQSERERNCPPPYMNLAFVIHNALFSHYLDTFCRQAFKTNELFHQRVETMDIFEKQKICYLMGWVAHKIFRRKQTLLCYHDEISSLEANFILSPADIKSISGEESVYSYIREVDRGNLCYPSDLFLSFGYLLEAFMYTHLQIIDIGPGRLDLINDILQAALKHQSLRDAYGRCLDLTQTEQLEEFADHLYCRCVELYSAARQHDFLRVVNSNIGATSEQSALRAALVLSASTSSSSRT